LLVTEKILTIWKPTNEVISLLQEGRRFRIFHLMARYTRWVDSSFYCTSAEHCYVERKMVIFTGRMPAGHTTDWDYLERFWGFCPA